MDADFKFENFGDLEKQLEQLGLAGQTSTLRKAGREAMKPVKQEVEQNIIRHGLVDTTELLGSVRIRTHIDRKDNQPYDVGISVGFDRKTAYKAYWFEHGVEPHALNTGSSLRQGRIGEKKKPKPKQVLMHPGFEPTPILSPSLDDNQQLVVNTVKTALSVAINKAIKKQRKA